MAQLVSDTCVLDLVEHIYAAGCEPTLWPELVHKIQALIPSSSCHSLFDLAGTHMFFNSAVAGIDDSFKKSYIEEYYAINPYNKLLASLEVGRVVTVAELCKPDWLAHDPFFHEWLNPAGNFSRGAGVVLARDSQRQLRMAIDLPERLAHHEAETARLLSRLAPHITRAFEVNTLLDAKAATSAALESLFDHLADAAFIVGLRGTVVTMNQRADELLRSGNLARLQNGTRLVFCNSDHDAAYQQALREAHDTSRSGAACAFSLSHQRYRTASAIVLPLRNQREHAAHSAQQPLAVVIIRRAKSVAQPPTKILQALYGLSRAESEVACLIADGHDTRAIAEQLDLSHTTIRNQLASAMAKMGVNRQAQVVVSVLELQPMLSLTDE